MQTVTSFHHLVSSDLSLLLPSNHHTTSFPSTHRHSQKLTLCAANRKKRYAPIVMRSGKQMFDSAFIIASKLRLLPEPLELILREFGAGNGGRNGSWSGFGWGGWFDGWKRRRRAKLTLLGMVVVVGIFVILGLWLGMGRELVVEAEGLFGGLGLIVFGASVEGWWRRGGAMDWILGFCCCAFLVGFVLYKEEFRTKKKYILRGKGRAF